jgi:hypothetical protein
MSLLPGQPAPLEEINVCLVILSVLIPLAGWILACVLHGKQPRTACACLIGASVSAGVTAAALIVVVVAVLAALSDY